MEYLAKASNNATVKETNSILCWNRLSPEPLSSMYQWRVQTMELQSIQIPVFTKKKQTKKRQDTSFWSEQNSYLGKKK